jgi:hypothetical protein
MRPGVISRLAMIRSLVVAVIDHIYSVDVGLANVTLENFMRICIFQQKEPNWYPKIGHHWCRYSTSGIKEA